MDVWIAISVFVALVALMIGSGYVFRNRALTAWKSVAEELGFQFHEKGDSSLLDRLDGSRLGSPQSEDRHIRGPALRRKVDGQEIIIFGLSHCHRTKHGSARRIKSTVFLLESTELDLPQFVAIPEAWLQKLGNLFGGEDIDFTDYPKFSGKFILRGEDETAIRQVMTDEVLRAFEEHTAIGISGPTFDGYGQQLFVYKYDKIACSAADLRNLLDAGLNVAKPLTRATQRGVHDIE